MGDGIRLWVISRLVENEFRMMATVFRGVGKGCQRDVDTNYNPLSQMFTERMERNCPKMCQTNVFLSVSRLYILMHRF